jgi:hypothetical protein
MNNPNHHNHKRRRRNDTETSSSAPLYITVGPQCCGKTTWLKTNHKNSKDISLDDQPDVFIPIPAHVWLSIILQNKEISELNLNFHGKTMIERIQNDNTELNLILKRWNQDLSPQNFAIQVLQLYSKNTQLAHLLIEEVEKLLSIQSEVPPHIQLFVLESLFKPHPSTQQSAIQRAHSLLRTTPLHIPVAWGNTNSKSKDYQQALEIASQTRRPVHFVYMGSPDLPKVGLKTLIQRNLQRLKETGKYIPSFAIQDCCSRIEKLIPQNATSIQVEEHLVQLASSSSHNHKHRSSPYIFRLTRQRLIEKEYPETKYRNTDESHTHRYDKRSYKNDRHEYLRNHHRHRRPPDQRPRQQGYREDRRGEYYDDHQPHRHGYNDNNHDSTNHGGRPNSEDGSIRDYPNGNNKRRWKN